jgi:retron-type reverse transcriptase
VNYVLDADIQGFFDNLDKAWMIKFVEHRVADRRILRLIQKWLKAGVMEDGKWSDTETGTSQGSVISPLLANIYLHYVFDLWVDVWRKKYARGEVIVLRYADDIVLGFQWGTDADRFRKSLEERLGKFGLELHPEKTRRIEFGRYATEPETKRRRQAGDLRLPWLHAYQREERERVLCCAAHDDPQAHAKEAAGDQAATQDAHA